MYTVVYEDWNPNVSVTRTELYQWITLLILTFGMIYFLWHSVKAKSGGKLKNPNELFSYLALGVINNCIFLAKLIYYAVHIKRDWLDQPYPDTPDTPSNIETMTITLFVTTFVSIVFVAMSLVLMIITAKPLRDRIFEEIFY